MKKSSGSTLIIVLLIALAALSIAIGMMQLSTTKTIKATNNKYSLQAYYAAEAGMQEAIDVMSDNQQTVIEDLVEDPSVLDLPTVDAPADFNGSEYYVEIKSNDGNEIVLESVGTSKHAKKKIRAFLSSDIDSAFEFGLLSKELVEIHSGNIEYQLDIHGNGEESGLGLDFKGNSKNFDVSNGAIATQSSHPDGLPDADDTYGLYRPEQDVPEVDFEYFESQMFGAVEPVSGENLSDVSNIGDLGQNLLFTEDYLLTNTDLDLSGLMDFSSALPVEKDKYVADNNFNSTNSLVFGALARKQSNFIVNNPVNLFLFVAESQFRLFTSPIALNLIVINQSYNKYIFGGGKGNTDPTPTPVPEPTAAPTPAPEPTAEPTVAPDADPTPTPEPTAAPTEAPPDEGGDDDGNKGKGNDQGGGNGDLSLYLPEGNYEGRIIYIDNANVGTLNISLGGLVENAVIVATGDIIFNGADRTDRGNTSGLLDFVIAAGGDITHNGSMDTGCFYWLNGEFTQNGNADFDDGRVMAQGNIRMNGKFALTTTYELADFTWIPKNFVVKSWQEIAAD